MSLLKVKFLKNIHIYARIYLIFLKNVLKQTLNSFYNKFKPQWKDLKSSYQVRSILVPFYNSDALILGLNSVKGLRVTKTVKEITFEGVWGELESKSGFQKQSFTKYFRLTVVFT